MLFRTGEELHDGDMATKIPRPLALMRASPLSPKMRETTPPHGQHLLHVVPVVYRIRASVRIAHIKDWLLLLGPFVSTGYLLLMLGAALDIEEVLSMPSWGFIVVAVVVVKSSAWGSSLGSTVSRLPPNASMPGVTLTLGVDGLLSWMFGIVVALGFALWPKRVTDASFSTDCCRSLPLRHVRDDACRSSW